MLQFCKKKNNPKENLIATKFAYDLAKFNYDHIERQATLVTNKAAILLAIYGVFVTGYFTFLKDINFLYFFAHNLLNSKETHFFFIAIITLLGGLLFAIFAIYPKITQSSEKNPLFFYRIAKYEDCQSFYEEFNAKTDAQLYDNVLQSIYGKSKTLRWHYNYLKISVVFLGIFVIFIGCSIFSLFDRVPSHQTDNKPLAYHSLNTPPRMISLLDQRG